MCTEDPDSLLSKGFASAEPEPQTVMRSKDLYNAGVDAYEAGELTMAARLFQRGHVAFATETPSEDSHLGHADCLSNLAVCYAELGKLDEAQHTYNDAIVRYDELLPQVPAAREDLARCHLNLGNTLNDLGQPHNALTAFTTGLQYYSSLDDTLRQQGMCIVGMANALQRMGRQAEAVELYRHALSVYEQLNYVDVYRADATMNLANVLGDLGRQATAVSLYRQALSIYRSDPAWSYEQAWCLMNMAATLRALDNDNQATRLYAQALNLLRQIRRDPHALGVCLMNYAIVLGAKGDAAAAEDALAEALKIFAYRQGSERERVLCLLNQAALFRDSSRFTDAEVLLAQARRQLPEVADPDIAFDVAYHEAILTQLQHKMTLSTDTSSRQRGLSRAVEAALHADEKRFSLTSTSDRLLWIRNVASQRMALALDYCADANNPLLMAELVAKWRMSGTLNARSLENAATDNTTGDSPTVALVPGYGSHLNPGWESQQMRRSAGASETVALPRSPGPLLHLPYRDRASLGVYLKVPESRARARYI